MFFLKEKINSSDLRNTQEAIRQEISNINNNIALLHEKLTKINSDLLNTNDRNISTEILKNHKGLISEIFETSVTTNNNNYICFYKKLNWLAEAISDITIYGSLQDKSGQDVLNNIKDISLITGVNLSVLLEFVNKKIFMPFDRELCASGGVARTFRFWSKTEKLEYINQNIELINMLRGIYSDVFLSYGTALGARRNGKLIDHDMDIDISIVMPDNIETDIYRATEHVEKTLHELGYNTQRGKNNCNIHIELDEEKFHDIWVGVRNSTYINWHPSPKNIIKYSDIFPLTSEYSLEGINIELPANIDKYLMLLYGDDWRTPNPSWASPLSYLESVS